MKPLVGIIMGSTSDWETLRHAAETLEKLGVPHEVRVVSAHRTPDLLFEYAASARDRGLQVLIAGAGGAAHLPGMAAAKTSLPVLGVPVQSKALNGLDSLLSIVQMPAGIPVGTLAIGVAGATNAALLAAAILGNTQPAIRAALEAFRAAQTDKVLAQPDPRLPPAAHEDRHHRRRPARADAGAGGLSRSRCSSASSTRAPRRPGAQVAPIVVGAFDDIGALRRPRAARWTSSPTSSRTCRWRRCSEMAATRPCFPPVDALRVSQDRILEKELFGRLGIPTPPYRAVDSLRRPRGGRRGPRAALRAQDPPARLRRPRPARAEKRADVGPGLGGARRRAADPRGLRRVRPRGVDHRRPQHARRDCAPTRSSTNTHREGILRVTVAPTRNARLQRAAEGHLRRVIDHFGYAGVLTIEFFVAGGRLVANEMAPRVHNSGHWTIEGAVTSQFENHLRAILGPAARRHQRRSATRRW